MKTVIKSLVPELLDDFLFFFDFLAFTDNPHWATCYCHYYHYPECPAEEWMKRSAAENRTASSELIKSGKMHGFLLYTDGKPVAWCHADARENILKLKDMSKSGEKEEVASIVCFIVAPEYRRQGLAASLLKHVCEDFASRGYKAVEAYPRKYCKSDAENYHGPRSMYEKQGFESTGENGSVYIMQKKL